MPVLTAIEKIPITRINVIACTIPTDFAESDGTLSWDHTTLVLVELAAGGRTGLGYTYADVSTAHFIDEHLAPLVQDANALDGARIWQNLVYHIRNLGRPGIVSMAIAAVDNALQDLRARLMEQPLVASLQQVSKGVKLYGSGGFTSYSIPKLQEQLGGWAHQGLNAVKMKVGTHPADDLSRVRAARQAIGSQAELFVDANGAYSRKQALYFAEAFAAEAGVTWFEEPVSSDDLEGLRLVRDRAPAGMDIAAGEYGYDLVYFERMLEAGAVDVLQADATRCAGITEFRRVAALCAARSMPLSCHTAPAQHLHAACAVPNLRHVEYFHDHVRIEELLFDGLQRPVNGWLYPDLTRPGNGLVLKTADAARYLVYGGDV